MTSIPERTRRRFLAAPALLAVAVEGCGAATEQKPEPLDTAGSQLSTMSWRVRLLPGRHSVQFPQDDRGALIPGMYIYVKQLRFFTDTLNPEESCGIRVALDKKSGQPVLIVEVNYQQEERWLVAQSPFGVVQFERVDLGRITHRRSIALLPRNPQSQNPSLLIGYALERDTIPYATSQLPTRTPTLRPRSLRSR